MPTWRSRGCRADVFVFPQALHHDDYPSDYDYVAKRIMTHFVMHVNARINFARNNRSLMIALYEVKRVKSNDTLRYVTNNKINDNHSQSE